MGDARKELVHLLLGGIEREVSDIERRTVGHSELLLVHRVTCARVAVCVSFSTYRSTARSTARPHATSSGDVEEIGPILSTTMPVADEGGPSAEHGPPLTDATEALLATQYGSWYPKLRKHAPKSTILDIESIQPEFLAWLDEDAVVLSDANDWRDPSQKPARRNVQAEAREVLSDDSDDEDDEPQFPALNAKLFEVLDKYGPVFPKLNWSGPLDAAWILPGNTVRCQTPNDVYLLLKSSDFAMKDLEQLQELRTACQAKHLPEPRVELVLKKWFEMPRSHEFRIFLRAGDIIGVCQRDVTFYEHLQDKETQDRILELVDECIDKVQEEIKLDDLVVDVYFTRHLENYFVIDVNPYLPRTDPLLWTFDELDEAAEAGRRDRMLPVPLRVITSPAQASQSQPTYSSNMIPADVVEIGSGHNIAEFAKEWTDQLASAIHGDDDQ